MRMTEIYRKSSGNHGRFTEATVIALEEAPKHREWVVLIEPNDAGVAVGADQRSLDSTKNAGAGLDASGTTGDEDFGAEFHDAGSVTEIYRKSSRHRPHEVL